MIYLFSYEAKKFVKEHPEEAIAFAKKGDFITVDRDHDYILKLQNGNIGFSKGQACPEEEAQFILEHFGRDID